MARANGTSDGDYAGPACPALVQVHGGGTNSYYQGTNLVEQYLASKGFVVLAINYRGGSGFGREFQELSIEDWLNDQSKDPGAAADWLRQQPYVNDKVGIYGGSYGGMQSMSAITRTPDKFDAAVPMRGIYSQALTLPYADRLGQIFAITGHGGTPEERPEIYEKTETLARMDRITAPVLVMHGEQDIRAPFKNFELAVERLRELGKEFESQTYPRGTASEIRPTRSTCIRGSRRSSTNTWGAVARPPDDSQDDQVSGLQPLDHHIQEIGPVVAQGALERRPELSRLAYCRRGDSQRPCQPLIVDHRPFEIHMRIGPITRHVEAATVDRHVVLQHPIFLVVEDDPLHRQVVVRCGPQRLNAVHGRAIAGEATTVLPGLAS